MLLGYRKNCDVAKHARIEFLVRTGIQTRTGNRVDQRFSRCDRRMCHNRPIWCSDIARFFSKASAYLSGKQSEYLSPCTSFGLAVAIALKLERFLEAMKQELDFSDCEPCLTGEFDDRQLELRFGCINAFVRSAGQPGEGLQSFHRNEW